MSLLRKLFLRGSAKGSTTEGDVTSTNVDANTQALDVVVKNTITAEVDTTGLATEATLQDILTSTTNIESGLSDGGQKTQVVDNLGVNIDFATASNQTDGSQKTKITDGAGVVNTKQLGTAITGSDVGLVTQGVIHGLSSSGGGTYVDVKVNPAGKLEVNDADTITTLTDNSQTTQIVDSLGDNIGTNTNPIYVTSSTSTQGVATFQQQYNQTELFEMILQELQEQTKLLKKIYQ